MKPTLVCVALTLACCTPAAVSSPAAPRIVVDAAPAFEGYPMPEGSYFTIAADWKGSCERHEGHILTLIAAFTKQSTTYSVPCDVHEFAFDISCNGHCEIVSEDGSSLATDRLHLDGFRGDQRFLVKPTGTQLQAFVTLRSAGATYTYDSPRFRIVPSTEFAIECFTRRGAVPCDQPIPARDDPQIRVRSTGELPLGAVAVNGERQEGRFTERIAKLFPHTPQGASGPPPPGIYHLTVEINPGAVHAVLRQLVLRID
jgi:hypothetical protein